MHLEELEVADEAFFTGTAAEVTPIAALDRTSNWQRQAGTDHVGVTAGILRRDFRARSEAPGLADSGSGEKQAKESSES